MTKRNSILLNGFIVLCLLLLGLAFGYLKYQEKRAHALSLSLTADGRFIASSVQQWFMNHPESEIYILPDMWNHPEGPGPTRDPDANYGPVRITRENTVIIMTHPDLNEPIYYTY